MAEFKKNEIHEAVITGYSSEGAGVCRIDGRAVFVKGALVGEKIEVRILKATKTAVYGKIENIITNRDMYLIFKTFRFVAPA